MSETVPCGLDRVSCTVHNIEMKPAIMSISLGFFFLLVLAGCSGNLSFHRMVREDWGAFGGTGRPRVAVLPVSTQGNRLLLEVARHAPGTTFANPDSADILVEIRPDDGAHLSLVALRRDTRTVLLTRSWITIDDGWSAIESILGEFARDFATNLTARSSAGGGR